MGGKTKDGKQKNPKSRWVKPNPRYTPEQEARFAAARVDGWDRGARVRRSA
jgi:hypothetical protein